MWKRGADQEQGQPVLKDLLVHVYFRQKEEGWRHKESQQQEWNCPRVEITSSNSLLSWLSAAAICLHWSRGFNLYSSSSHACPGAFRLMPQGSPQRHSFLQIFCCGKWSGQHRSKQRPQGWLLNVLQGWLCPANPTVTCSMLHSQ